MGMSKGSSRRPAQVDNDKFNSNYDKIFGVSKVVQAEEVEDTKAGPTKQGTVVSVSASRRTEGKG